MRSSRQRTRRSATNGTSEYSAGVRSIHIGWSLPRILGPPFRMYVLLSSAVASLPCPCPHSLREMEAVTAAERADAEEKAKAALEGLRAELTAAADKIKAEAEAAAAERARALEASMEQLNRRITVRAGMNCFGDPLECDSLAYHRLVLALSRIASAVAACRSCSPPPTRTWLPSTPPARA